MDKETTAPSTNKKPQINRWLWLVSGLLIGAALFVIYRALVSQNEVVHYHANFAVYVNGKQDKFEGPGYYEEVTTCNVHDHNDLKSRAHMHGNNSHVVHVHADSVTWGNFFANLGYAVGDNVISDGHTAYVEGQDDKHLTFMLNGQKVDSIANQIIKSEDVLLIDYGNDSDTTLKQYFEGIPKDAHKFNVTADPAACSGGETYDVKSRLKDALGFTD